MSNYSQVTSFTPKDALASGNPAKVIKGSDFDAEFGAISTAIATKADSTDLASKRNVSETVSVIGTNTNAVTGYTYVLTASLTLTLPATPAVGDFVRVINRSGTLTAVVGRNSLNIMGLAEDMTLDNLNASMTLIYADATRGWVWN